MTLKHLSPLLDGVTRQARISTWEPGRRGEPLLLIGGSIVEAHNPVLEGYAVLDASPQEMRLLAEGGYGGFLEGVELAETG